MDATGRRQIGDGQMEERVDNCEGVGRGDNREAASDSGLRLVHGSIELCIAIETAISPAPRSREDPLDDDRQTEIAMQHFHA